MTEFARELTEELARKLPTASMGTIIGGGRSQPMYYDPKDPERIEYTARELWERLSYEEQEQLRDYAYCCFYNMAGYGYERVMEEAFLEYCEREGK